MAEVAAWRYGSGIFIAPEYKAAGAACLSLDARGALRAVAVAVAVAGKKRRELNRQDAKSAKKS
ncbi:hypothetical protein ES703_73552 [subsurface metagenome]